MHYTALYHAILRYTRLYYAILKYSVWHTGGCKYVLECLKVLSLFLAGAVSKVLVLLTGLRPVAYLWGRSISEYSCKDVPSAEKIPFHSDFVSRQEDRTGTPEPTSADSDCTVNKSPSPRPFSLAYCFHSVIRVLGRMPEREIPFSCLSWACLVTANRLGRRSWYPSIFFCSSLSRGLV